MEKFYAKIKTVGNSSKMIVVPANIIKGLNWTDGTEVVVMIKQKED